MAERFVRGGIQFRAWMLCSIILLNAWSVQADVPLRQMPSRVAVEESVAPVEPPLSPWSSLATKSARTGGVSRGKVVLARPDLTRTLEEDSQVDATKGAKRISIRRKLPEAVKHGVAEAGGGGGGGKGAVTSGWQEAVNGGRYWAMEIASEEALAMRVSFQDVDLPEGVRLLVYAAENPGEVVGPYDQTFLDGRTAFWSETVFSARVIVECQADAGVPIEGVRFQLNEITHRYVLLPGGSSGVPKAADFCHNDVSCNPEWIETARAVTGLGVIQFSGELFCTGCLLNDADEAPATNYMLTAQHCVQNQIEADDVEVYWMYQTASCFGVVPSLGTVPRSRGGTVFVGGSMDPQGNDFALLRIRGSVPAGATYAGWSSEAPADFEIVTSIHHPDGDYKRISFGYLNGLQSFYWPVVWWSGVTEPGSSGSPLFNAQQQVIGQLYGGFSACDFQTGEDIYGRMAHTIGLIGRWLSGEPTIAVNNDFVGGQVLSGPTGSVIGNNLGATRETGEPTHGSRGGGRSVWYRWVAPETGSKTFDTYGSEFAATLAVYVGETVGQLTQIVSSDGIGFGLGTEVTFEAVEETTYHVAVDGTDGGAGRLSLSWGEGGPGGGGVSPHDNFENALEIHGERGERETRNYGATKEPGEPDHAGVEGGASVWFRWTAPATGTYRFDTEGSGFDTIMAVYTGESVNLLVVRAQNDDINSNQGIYTSRVTLNAQSGVTYHIAVDGYGESPFVDQGFILLTWMSPPVNSGPAPDNDNFAQARLLELEGNLSMSNQRATREAGEPTHAGTQGGRSVWFRWESPGAGLVTWSTEGSDFDTVLGVYHGLFVSGLIPLASNDDVDFSTRQSLITWRAEPGVTYHVAVDGFRTASQIIREGIIKFDWEYVPGIGNNASFGMAQEISGSRGETPGENWSATAEFGEPTHGGNGSGASVWYRWQSPATAAVTMDTLGSSFDTVLAIYTGTTLGDLTPVVANDDINLAQEVYQSRVAWDATAGGIYWIAVDGVQFKGLGERGSLRLNWLQDAVELKVPELSWIPGPSGKPVIRVEATSGQTLALMSSTDLDKWTNVASGVVEADGTFQWEVEWGPGVRFYRVQQP